LERFATVTHGGDANSQLSPTAATLGGESRMRISGTFFAAGLAGLIASAIPAAAQQTLYVAGYGG
jgi:hypothetical protein